MPHARLHAFIDEAGQRARTAKSSDHFVMSAAIGPDEHSPMPPLCSPGCEPTSTSLR